MELNRLCPGCMNELTDEQMQGACPYCGYHADPSQEEPSHRLRPHTVLNDKYVIGKVLGEGGFGITYLGYDLTLEMKIAIKEYYPAGYVTREVQNGNTVTTFSGEKAEFYQNGKEKFIHEARTLAKFSTLPGIVSVRDYFEANNTSYIIMEYLDGDTLKSYLRKCGGRMPLPTVLDMMQPVIRSLEEVHKQGLIHRDISPDNIMILKNGSMKLLDFGAARAVAGPEADKSLSVMLKPGYAPEEQYRTHGNQGPWTDLYAISATIYKCLTGKTPLEAMERMRNDALVPPRNYGVMMPPWQEAALMKGLALYAENRFHTLDEFYNAFYLNQYSEEKYKNDGRTGAGMANQTGSAWGGKMNPQDNQFGGQQNGMQYDPATGMPLNQQNANPYPQQTGNYGNQGNGMPGATPYDQNAQFTTGTTQNGAYVNNTQNGAFGANPAQNAQFGANPQNAQFGMNNGQQGQFGAAQNDPYAMNNNFGGPQYAYGGVMPNNNAPQKKSKVGLIVGIIVAVIVVIIAALLFILFGGKKDKDKDTDATVTGTPVPTEAIVDEATPTPTPEPADEETPTPEPTEMPVIPDVTYSEGDNFGASFTGYTDENVSYMILKNNQWTNNTLIYTDSSQYYVLSDERVSFFDVIDGELYFSTYDDSTETYSFWKMPLSDSATPEYLFDGVCNFSYVDGMIFYDNYSDYYSLWCYDPALGSNNLVDSDKHSLNHYYILNGYIYYECLDDGNVYKMSLNGSDKQVLFALSDYNISHMDTLVAFDIQGSVFLSFTSDDGYMYITTEDGSAYEEITSGLDTFDLNQDIYFANGSLYYSDGNGMEIHKLDIEEYLTTDATEITDTTICDDSFVFFEVNNGLIYVELYGGNNEIKVLDSQTGEEYNVFDFS